MAVPLVLLEQLIAVSSCSVAGAASRAAPNAVDGNRSIILILL